LLKTVGLVDCLREALADERTRLALVYGSVVTGEDREGSDVDVLVVTEAGPREVSDRVSAVEGELGREINTVVLTTSEYRERLQRGDHFMRSVMAGPKLYVIGDDDEAARLAE
jgi:predicted nucleotidyltransferase